VTGLSFLSWAIAVAIQTLKKNENDDLTGNFLVITRFTESKRLQVDSVGFREMGGKSDALYAIAPKAPGCEDGVNPLSVESVLNAL
jgi:hypothetical protein